MAAQKNFQVGDMVATFNENDEIFYGEVIGIRDEWTVTVDFPPPFRMGKGYRGWFAVSQLYKPKNIEAAVEQHKASRRNFRK